VLILTRKAGQSIVLTTKGGERIEVKITKVGLSRCSVAIDAPLHVKIVRSELEDKAA
jgi:carbon storage regulator CsrA